jgi:hypothetical protein
MLKCSGHHPLSNIHSDILLIYHKRRSQRPRSLTCGSAAVRFLGLWFRILPGAWMSVPCECCALLRRVLCVELITRPEESYRLWCIVKPRQLGGPGPLGAVQPWQKKYIYIHIYTHIYRCVDRTFFNLLAGQIFVSFQEVDQCLLSPCLSSR